MDLFKFLLFVLLSIILNAKAQKVKFKTGGGWSKVLIDELPEKEKDLKFFQLKDLNEFRVELVENPFDRIAAFKLMLLHFEFWCKFNESERLVLRLQICQDQYSWPLEHTKKQVALKVFNESYISSKPSQSCLSKFDFKIINPANLSSTASIELNEINVLHLAAYYSPVDLPIKETSDLDQMLNAISDAPIERFECKQENCNAFAVNSKKIKNRKFYPRSNSEWASFYLSEAANETLRIELAEQLKLASGRDYKIEFFYFVTENVRLRLFTSADRYHSIISLYPTYSYLPDNERFKYLPVAISLKDLLPFNLSSVQSGFGVFIQTEILPTDSEFDGLPMAAVSNIRIRTSGDLSSQTLTDFLAHWNIHGERASNEWACLVDQTSFYAGEQNYDLNNISISFFAPKFKSKATYLLLSRWSLENGQQFEIKITAEPQSVLLIETIDERLKVLNSQLFELDQWRENALHYDVLGGKQSIARVTNDPTEPEGQRVIRFKLSFILRNEDSQPKKVVVSSVNYGDPCGQPDRCVFAKECRSRSSTQYKCECLPNYHGKACEWPDRCAADPPYCRRQNGSCTPIRGSFKCNCAEGSFWLNDRRACQPLPYCFSKRHLQDEQCVYEYDYETSEDCNEHETFDCNRLFEPSSYIGCVGLKPPDPVCQENEEKAITSLSSSLPNALGSFCVCNRENGFIENGTDQTGVRCVQPTNQNPFLKQYLSCSQTYRFSFFRDADRESSSTENATTVICKPECACWPGFELAKDCRPARECTLTCGQNQFCGFDENGNQTCLCELGYTGDCRSNFCEEKANEELIRKFCGPFGCKVANLTGQPKFFCNCEEELYEKNLTTGLCQMRDVCAPGSRNDLECRSKEAVCFPSLAGTVLTHTCRCAKGWLEDPLTGDCVELCALSDQHELLNQECFPSLTLNSSEFLCKPGFVADQNDFCVLSEKEHKYELQFEARLNVDARIYRSFNQIKNRQLNETERKTEDCSNLLDPEGCATLMNRSYLQLEERSNSLLINRSFVHAFSRLISLSLQSVLGDDLAGSRVLGFQVLDQFSGLKVTNQTTRPHFKVLNLSVYIETNNFFEHLDDHFFFSGCKSPICPLYPYLHVSRQSFGVNKLKLNESDLLTGCFPNSRPVFVANSNSLFRCGCVAGFARLSKVRLSHDPAYYKEICVDEDECAQKNDCDPASTVCVNLAGDYRCDCKSGLIRRNRRSCENADSRCDLNTTSAVLLDRDYECKCKQETFVKKSDFSCTDPCLGVRCESGECLPYRSSYVCANVDNASAALAGRLSIGLFVCILTLIHIPVQLIRSACQLI